MHHSLILTRQSIGGAALVLSVLFAGSASAGARNATEIETVSTVAQILPGDRGIAQIEGREPGNSGVTFIVSPASSPDTPREYPEPLNICIPCYRLT